MQTGFPFFRSGIEAELRRLQKAWFWLLLWGILLALVGTVAVVYPVVATLATVEIIGVFLLIAAGGQVAGAFFARGWGGAVISLLCGVLYFFAGVIFIERPLVSAAGFTLFLAMLFVAAGVARIAAAFSTRFAGWGWTLLSGLVSLILGVLVWRDLPEAALWVIGTFVGIDLIFAGWAWIMLALGVKNLPAAHAAP
jgi:uncharacterized membrane protein HdeD (DUF308 family)